MKNDTPGFDAESNKINGPGCDSGDWSIRVLYLYNYLFCTFYYSNLVHIELLHFFENDSYR